MSPPTDPDNPVWMFIFIATASATELDVPHFDPQRAVAAAGMKLHEGPLEAVFTDGVLVPLYGGADTEPIGFAFVGAGTLSGTLADRGDAWALANRQVLLLDEPPDRWRPIAHQEAPFTCLIHRGFVWADAALARPYLTGALTPTDVDLADLLVQINDWDDALGPGYGQENHLPASDMMASSFACDRRLGYVDPGPIDTPGDHWLGLWRDRAGVGLPDDLVALGRDAEGKRRFATVALGPWSPRDVPANVDPAIHVQEATIALEATRDGDRIDVTSTTRFRFEVRYARDHVIAVLNANTRERDTVAFVLDGVPIQETRAGWNSSIEAPFEPGRTYVLDVTSSGHATLGTHGPSTYPRSFTPTLETSRPPFTLSIRVPEASGLGAVAAGRTVKDELVDGVRVLETVGAGEWPTVVFGEFATIVAPASDGLPAVRASLYKDERHALPSIPPFVRGVLAYDQGLLPPFPYGELEIVRMPDRQDKMAWRSEPGLVILQTMLTSSADPIGTPHFEELYLARKLIEQWTDAMDIPRSEDEWIRRAIDHVYSCAYKRAAFPTASDKLFGDTACDAHPTVPAGFDLRRAPTTNAAYILRGMHGADVLELLRARIGDAAFFGAIDAWMRTYKNEAVSVDTLQEAFEATSGRDLSAFFDAWVESGFIPALTLAWDEHGAIVSSDVPFGITEVPITITYADGTKETRWVTVTDGTGEATFAKAPTTVKLDAQHQVLARKRKVVAR